MLIISSNPIFEIKKESVENIAIHPVRDIRGMRELKYSPQEERRLIAVFRHAIMKISASTVLPYLGDMW